MVLIVPEELKRRDMKEFTAVVLFFGMLLSPALFAENKPVIPALTAEQKLKARELQLHETQLLNQLQQMQLDFNNIQKNLVQADQEFSKFKTTICGTGFNLNLDNLTCEKVPEERKVK